MQVLGNAPPTLTADQIIGQHNSSLEQIVKAAKEPEFEFERLAQINKARRNWQMVKGNHFLIPGIVGSGANMSMEPVSWDGTGNEETGADVRFARPVNLIGGDCSKFVAVMGATAPRVKAVADDPEDAQSIEDAKNADATLRDLWEKWDADQQQRVLAFHQYTTGPIFLRTQWVVDGQKYGQTTEPNIEVADDGTGAVPKETGEPHVYENGDVELRAYTVLEVSVPYMSKSLHECGFLNCAEMRSKWDLIAAYSKKLEQYREQDLPDDSGDSSAFNSAAEARESVATPSGTGRVRKQNMWPFSETWVQPFLYEAVNDKDVRDVLKRQYPGGLYIAKVGSVTVDIDHRKLTDEWAVVKTGRGEKILEDPICSDAVPYQQTINDLFGMALETALRQITQTIVDSQLIDRAAMAKKEALPAEIILTMMPADGDISKRIAQIPGPRFSDQLVPFINLVRATWQDNTGIRPELSGGGAPTNTYREAKQRKDQALQQLAPQAQEEQYGWIGAGTNGVKMRARYGTGTIKVPRKGSFGPETDMVDMARLSESGWHIEADDNFPMSSSDRFDKIWAILKEFPPEVQQILGVYDPINVEEMLELLQIPGFESVQADQKRKTLGDIARLAQEQPVDGQPGPNGQPGPKQPSIAIDQYDDHAFVAAFVPKWMISRAGEKVKNTQPAGFENIEAFWQAHQQAAQPPAPPPAPPVRAALNLSAKLEDFPALVPGVLQGAGLPAPPPGAEVPQPPPLDPNKHPPAGPGPSPTPIDGEIPPPSAPPDMHAPQIVQ